MNSQKPQIRNRRSTHAGKVFQLAVVAHILPA
jgi:hypothetical protein